MLLAIYRYRGFILGSVQREFQAKYQKSMLGATWLVLQPLSMILVYTLVFSKVMGARLPNVTGVFTYSIYLCIGVITWGLFAEILNRSQNMFVENAGLLKKLSFPKICLPIIIVLSAAINFLIIFLLFIIFLVLTGNFHFISFIEIIPVLIIQIFFAIGLGMSLGVINVFFRDVSQFVGILLQFWFWFTPIVYVMSTLPIRAQGLLRYNPMAVLVDNYQQAIINQRTPDWLSIFPVIIITVLLCILGIYLFKRHAADMVDEL
ncbi:ABC transporter permease [Yersinia frederiksenii]|uniref:ABC transporter permease n=1 Tax=Yersinia frederiksenii TaxID=29484 RepID=UPI00067B581E|nr:ABC transporter permease [Yersinia frederiksenii]